MSRKSKISMTFSLLTILVTLPIWYFLLHRVLAAVHASELMWFLYWVYVPAHLVAAFLSAIAQSMFEED